MLTIDEQTARINAARNLWTMVLPDIKAPSNHRLLLWVTEYDDRTISRALHRAASKFERGLTDPDALGKFASAVMRDEKVKRQEGAGRLENYGNQSI